MGIRRHGVIWPDEYKYEAFIDLTYAKKWRMPEMADVKADPGDCLEAGLKQLFPSMTFSPWTRDMVHDFAKYDKYAMIGCGACGKSYVMAACGIAHWIVDPFSTAVVFSSQTLKDLETRAWSPVMSLFTELKSGFGGPIPGKIVGNKYAILNEKDADMAETQEARASIQGRALDEGRLQGLHLPWICFFVDELALVKDIEALKTHLANIRIGTKGMKFVSAANPDGWDSPNSVFYLPPAGVKVDADTGSWMSATGYFVRHFDGEKSPTVLDHSLKDKFDHLISQQDVDEILLECNGDKTHPRYWKMVRGFPRAVGTGIPIVLDPVTASQNRVSQPLEEPTFGKRRRIGLSAGIDPAWSEGGDDAVYAGCEIVEQDGRVFLDFSGRVSKMPVSVDNPAPVLKQLRDGVIGRMNADGGPDPYNMAFDSSGNQSLADEVDLYVGAGCMHVNNSERASDKPVRAMDARPARRYIADRGAEAWCVLAEFCRAGQVRGLPQRAVDALVSRRFVVKANSTEPVSPLRLEPKEQFMSRFRGSPNDTDACALAAVAVKERIGVIPFGGVPQPEVSAVAPEVGQEYGATGDAAPEIPQPDFSQDADVPPRDYDSDY